MHRRDVLYLGSAALAAAALFPSGKVAMARPITTINIPPAPITPNVDFVSASSIIPNDIQRAEAFMVDPSGAWPNNVDPSRSIKAFGVQINRGVFGWRWWLFLGNSHDSIFLNDGNTDPMPLDPSQYLLFGTRERNGGLPRVLISSSRVFENVGQEIRLGILSGAAINLGARIDVQ